MRHLLLRLLASAPPFGDHVPDAELLRRFVASNDSAAFELIVHRHANAVWAVCRRVLRSEADAEDAFQATFLALVRKAKSIRTPCAGGWLHRVAVNASLKLRERAARTASLEPNQLDAFPAPTAGPDTDLAAAVHEELSRLSERERLPVVLCDLEGLSHADAATALGWPVGTVSGRLSRARAKLRERLERRGLAPSAALLPALPVPPHLIPNALSLTAGTAPPAVVSLAEGALAMTATTTWKWVAVAMVCASALGAGGVLAFGPGGGILPPVNVVPAPAHVANENPVPPAKGKPADVVWVPVTGSDGKTLNGSKSPTAFPEIVVPTVDPNDPDRAEKYAAAFAKLCPRLTGAIVLKVEETDSTLQKLLKLRLDYGVKQLARFREVIRKGAWNAAFTAELFECLTDMQAAASELWGGQPKELIPWLEELVVVTKEMERFHLIRILNGTDPPQRLDGAIRHRLRAETALLKAKTRA